MRKAVALLYIILIASVFIGPAASAQPFGPYGPEGNIEDWAVIESNYATIYVDRDIHVEDVSERIDVSFARYDPIERELFLGKGFTDEEKLAGKIDIIVRRAKQILDMHPQDLHIRIRVYESGEDMWSLYEDIFKGRKEHVAFYIHKFETIYIPVENVSGSVLAHEIGHSIIDTYFKILPPEKIRELLACYVDVHLKD